MSIRDWVQLGTGDEGSAIHMDGSLRYGGQVVVPQLIGLRKRRSSRSSTAFKFLCIQVA